MLGGSGFSRILLQISIIIFLAGGGLGILNTSNGKICDRCICHSATTLCVCNNNLKNITVQDLPSNTWNLTIINCETVTIAQNAISNLKSLDYVRLSNIRNLHLEKHCLNWTNVNMGHKKLTINIENSRIHEIPTYAVQGMIGEIHLRNTEIYKIKPFAFSNLKSTLDIVEIQNCSILHMEGQAFKILHTDNFRISDTHIEYLPSRSFLDIEVNHAFVIKNCTFNTLKPGAFIIKKPQSVHIVNSHFSHMDGECFNMSVLGNVEIQNNVFENIYDTPFVIVSARPEYQRIASQKIKFDNNTFNTLKVNPLYTKRLNFPAKYGTVLLNQTCTCLEIDAWVVNGGWKEHVHCIMNKGYVRAKMFKNEKCDTSSNTATVIIAVFVSVLVSVVLAIVAFIVYRKYKVRKKNSNVTDDKNDNGMLGLIVPDGRTYRETELHVIVEKAELLTTEL